MTNKEAFPTVYSLGFLLIELKFQLGQSSFLSSKIRLNKRLIDSQKKSEQWPSQKIIRITTKAIRTTEMVSRGSKGTDTALRDW